MRDETWKLDVSADANADVKCIGCPSSSWDQLEWEPRVNVFLRVGVKDYETRWEEAE